MTPEYINAKQAATYLGVSVRTVWAWCYERRISSYRLGRTVRFKISDLEEYALKGLTPAK